MTLRNRLARLERENPAPQCRVRGLRNDDGPGTPCPSCGDPDCGVIVVEYVVVHSNERGELVDEAGNLRVSA